MRSKMTGTEMTEVRALDLTVHEVLFVMAAISGFSFKKSTLTQIDFSEADLRNCDFRETVFEDCLLQDARLHDCRFEGADLRGANLGGIQISDSKRYKGAIISKQQAADLISQLGLQVL